ncbi:MAG: hypothetical protein LBT51_10240 [Fusobacteriaceae bacterium]|jgi:hypothetical protein|nr:hypothetical protein [Fusobacteriaceae bacterium]
MALEKYGHYFSIDEDYFPAVTEDLINRGKVDWKKFYPHETFVKLLKDTVSVLTRQQKLSIWVEGAYGTGKSHAVLTLKKLLDADENQVKEYFGKYIANLPTDLFNKFQGVKNQGQILTIHRYGSSTIHSDRDLIFAVQESIKKSLEDRKIENKGQNALKEAVIAWLSDIDNRNFFNSLITGKYANGFDGDNVEIVIEKLNTLSEESLIHLMNKIFKVADEVGINAIKIDIDGLISWIKNVIYTNNLKAIVFIWDEFTEYFYHNRNSLTGFQKLVELGATEPFCFMIVTHKSAALFDDSDRDKMKILDRFIRPTCSIELPENMAFQLIGAAMEKNQDSQILSDWDVAANDLNKRLKDSRDLVKKRAGISEKELMNILPIHPYTALLLKYVSSAFNSNQRSMFDFIKNDKGEEIKGFQWFIKNYGPADDAPLLTIDMLWDFFYEKGKENLSPDIRTILDSYSRQSTKNLNEEEQKVLKTVLLLQAISQKVGDSVELFISNDKNVNNAYDGSELENGAAGRIAEKLVKEQILYKKPLGANKFQYSAMINANDAGAIERIKEELRKKSTFDLVSEGNVLDAFTLNGALGLRYKIEYATSDSFKAKINTMRNQEDTFANKILAIATFARNDEESAAISKAITAAVKDGSYKMIFIDTSSTPLGSDAFEQYLENMANSNYHRGKDNSLASQYENNAKEVLKKWKNRILDGEFILYNKEKPQGERFSNFDDLCDEFSHINKNKFPLGIENYKVIDNMFAANFLKLGAECGISQIVTGTFKSGNPNTKLDTALAGAWNVDGYWSLSENRNLLITKIKTAIDEEIDKSLIKDGKVSIAHIYNILSGERYGFMPCNLTAFILGFLLKEYANDTYRWYGGQDNGNMSATKLKDMIEEVIRLQITPNSRYEDKFIVKMTNDEMVFNEVTASIFNIPPNLCTSVERTISYLGEKMQKLIFPIWSLKYILEKMEIKSSDKVIKSIIDKYLIIANSQSIEGLNSGNQIALDIGKIYADNPLASEDLKKLITKEHCEEGIIQFLSGFENGQLISLSNEIGDRKQYINVLKKRFVANSASLIWNIGAAEQIIKEVIIEYKIIAESNKIIGKATSFTDCIYNWSEKIKFIKISYDAIKDHVVEVKPFLEMLVMIKRSGALSNQQKEFLFLLQAKKDAFSEFYNNQINIFKKACEFYIDRLSNDEIEEIFRNIPTEMFIKEKSEYLKIVEGVVSVFIENQGKTKLKTIWKSKTGTDNPQNWSSKYLTPILCMVSDGERDRAKVAFECIKNNNTKKGEIEKAIDYFEKAAFFASLNNEDERNDAFRKYIIKDFSVMLTDIDEVRDYLNEKMTSEPYDWFANIDVEKRLRAFAESKYNTGGSNKALEIIENMDETKLKIYLKRLIKDNMTVGIEIIKDK